MNKKHWNGYFICILNNDVPSWASIEISSTQLSHEYGPFSLATVLVLGFLIHPEFEEPGEQKDDITNTEPS